MAPYQAHVNAFPCTAWKGPYNRLQQHFFRTIIFSSRGFHESSVGLGLGLAVVIHHSLAGVDELVGCLEKIIQGDAAVNALQQTAESNKHGLTLINDSTKAGFESARKQI